METKLTFVITMQDGEVVNQEFTVPPDQMGPMINQGLMQYATVGMLRKEGNKFKLTCPSQLKTVEVEIPAIILANLGDMPKTETQQAQRSGLIVE
jgi:hypothetical protein